MHYAMNATPNIPIPFVCPPSPSRAPPNKPITSMHQPPTEKEAKVHHLLIPVIHTSARATTNCQNTRAKLSTDLEEMLANQLFAQATADHQNIVIESTTDLEGMLANKSSAQTATNQMNTKKELSSEEFGGTLSTQATTNHQEDTRKWQGLSSFGRCRGMLTRFHAGYFRISLSLCGQAFLWKTLSSPSTGPHALRPLLRLLPSAAFVLLWSLALLSLAALSLLFAARCLLFPRRVRAELAHHVGMNYLFAPSISWLLLLLSTPFLRPSSAVSHLLWWLFSLPILVLDVKIYGQWFTKGKKFLSMVANPTSQITVIGNLVGARAAAEMGRRESAVCMFALGIAHYLVLFVTLYQRFLGSDSLPAMLRPVFFLFFAAPSMASLAWASIAGSFDTSCKMLFFLSLFLFASLIFRPSLFKKSMRRFNVAWWAYSFPLTFLALAATEYAQEVKEGMADLLMLVICVISVIVTLALLVFTTIRTNDLLPHEDPFACSRIIN